MNKINIARRIFQILSLVLLVYGGYIFKEWKESAETEQSIFPSLKAPPGSISTTKFEKGSILWPSGATPVIENYPPSLVCRFNPKGGMFKACILHFFSENLTWQTQIKYLLPYITLFILLCFLFGRMWCGWVCPIGTVGDFLTFLRRKMNIKVRRFPQNFRINLSFTGYGIMAIALTISTIIGMPNFARYQCYWFLPYCQICPARLICPMFGLIKPNWKDFSTGITTTFTILAWLVLGLFVAAFYFGRRVWCHMCPVGLINSWFNKGAGVELHKKAIKCIKCGYCADACPMGLTKMYQMNNDGIYNQNACIMCFRCVEVCPRENCLGVKFFGKELFRRKNDTKKVS
ncbi:MAG: 4Fe-4S binding protein [Candidatus Omnitrophica bacterium]|nr:4Fe-4S binding protein [Candidatus Omnitrophota bacterium]MCM8817383.1 4Fe-4S binding protein [Candidatus Omnitrophota bacterium]